MSAMALALKAMGAVPEPQRVWGVHEAQGAELLVNFRCFFPQPQITLGKEAHFLTPYPTLGPQACLISGRKVARSLQRLPFLTFWHRATPPFNLSTATAGSQFCAKRVSALPDCWSNIPRILPVCPFATSHTHLPRAA